MERLLFSLGVLAFFVLSTLSGCALHDTSAQFGGMTTFDGISQEYPADAQSMATTAALELARRYPPGRTTLSLVSVPGVFGETLESALRGQGFALVPINTPGIRTGYVLDVVQGELSPTAYLRVKTSDNGQFGLVRQLKGGSLVSPPAVMPLAPLSTATRTSLLPETTPVSPLTPLSPVATPRASGNQNTLLPKAVLTVLPYDWRYQIPDVSKRSLRVGWPKNVPWRESIRAMATEAGCEANFNDSARRVTLLASVDTRRVSTASTSAPTAPISALHPASVPEVIPPKAPPLTAPKPEVKVEVPTQEPAVIQDALGGGVSASAATPASAKPEVLPVIPASSLASVPHLPPAKTEESDGSNPLLLQAQKSKASLPEEIWTLSPGSLQKQLEGWAGRAGYQLVWKSSSDLDMESRASFKGSFIGAIQQLFQGLHKSGHPLRVTLYQNNSVIEVSEK